MRNATQRGIFDRIAFRTENRKAVSIDQYLVLVTFVAVVLIGQVKDGLNAMEIKHIVNDPML